MIHGEKKGWNGTKKKKTEKKEYICDGLMKEEKREKEKGKPTEKHDAK